MQKTERKEILRTKLSDHIFLSNDFILLLNELSLLGYEYQYFNFNLILSFPRKKVYSNKKKKLCVPSI